MASSWKRCWRRHPASSTSHTSSLCLARRCTVRQRLPLHRLRVAGDVTMLLANLWRHTAAASPTREWNLHLHLVPGSFLPGVDFVDSLWSACAAVTLATCFTQFSDLVLTFFRSRLPFSADLPDHHISLTRSSFFLSDFLDRSNALLSVAMQLFILCFHGYPSLSL